MTAIERASSDVWNLGNLKGQVGKLVHDACTLFGAGRPQERTGNLITPTSVLTEGSSDLSKIIKLESRERALGVFSFGPINGDRVIVFGGQAYLDNLPYLIDAATLFLHTNVEWDIDFCRELMVKGMSVDHLMRKGEELNDETRTRILARREREIPSVFLFREEQAPEGHYLGISVQRKVFVKTESGLEVPVLDHILRAFERDFRGSLKGRLSVGWGLWHHKGAMFYVHKTGNPIASYTNTQSEYLVQEDAHPWGAVDIKDPLMKEVRDKTMTKFILLPGREILPNGVIRRDYPEPNRGFKPEELRGGALKMFEYMKDPKGLDWHYEEGDSVAPFYRVVAFTPPAAAAA